MKIEARSRNVQSDSAQLINIQSGDVQYLLALHSVNGLGPIRLKLLIDYFQNARLVWQADQKELKKTGLPENAIRSLADTRKKLDPEKYLEEIIKAKISWLTIFDKDYPPLLKEIPAPPVVLFYKGEILPSDSRAVAVVGTRKITGYGRMVTEKFTKGLVDCRVTIVSGLARGVDSLAHRTAVEANGRTLAVLGGGLKHIFPLENARLAEQICNGYGAVISEFAPDEESLPGNFPARNRIISGLSLGVLVTEAAEDSGSLITARCALDQGREVFAVPGPITSDLSQGPSLLIKQGARLVTSAEEIMEELGISQIKNSKLKVKSDLKLNDLEQKILESLNEEKHVDEVCRELNLSAAEVSATLMKLEIVGLVKNLGGGNFTKFC